METTPMPPSPLGPKKDSNRRAVYIIMAVIFLVVVGYAIGHADSPPQDTNTAAALGAGGCIDESTGITEATAGGNDLQEAVAKMNDLDVNGAADDIESAADHLDNAADAVAADSGASNAAHLAATELRSSATNLRAFNLDEAMTHMNEASTYMDTATSEINSTTVEVCST